MSLARRRCRCCGIAADSSEFLAAIGLRALAARGEAPRGWEGRALRRLRRAGSNEITYVLDALAATATRPVLAEVLPVADDDWPVEPACAAFRRFAERRLGPAASTTTSSKLACAVCPPGMQGSQETLSTSTMAFGPSGAFIDRTRRRTATRRS